MRLIGEIDDVQQAEKFAAYLITEGTEVQLDPQDSGRVEIWVKDEDRFDSAQAALEEFREDSGNRKYSDAIQEATQIERQREKKRREIQKKMVHVGAGGVRRKPAITILLIGICAVVALLTDFGDSIRKGGDAKIFKALEFVYLPPDEAAKTYVASGGNLDSLNVRLASIKQGEIWRLVTPIFIHHGTMHILFNMIWLYQLGSLIEHRYGKWSLLFLVLASAAISNFVQCTVPGALDGSVPQKLPDGSLMTLLGGMSGVVYGLLGFVWMKSSYDRSSGFYLSQSTLVFMLGWMFLCFLPSFQQMLGVRIANWAHGIGLLVGIAVGYAPLLWKQGKR